MEIHQIIQEKLDGIETDFGVQILYACESGSRAWGFASEDSDWDVRFIYAHPPAWYVSLLPGRDVIELPVNAVLDISGWDLRKALNLMCKSNPPLLEWLDSPIVYRKEERFFEGMRELIPDFFSAKACGYHYLHMAQKNYRAFMKEDLVKLKKYLYILRPVLGCLWLEQRDGPVPMRFEAMVDALLAEGQLKSDIHHLVELKKTQPEMGVGPKIPSINAFLEREMARLEEVACELDVPESKTRRAGEFFRHTLRRLWPREW